MDKKKYYYIKLKDNYFDQDNIKILEAMKNGHTYSLILIKMYLKASKYNGKLMMTPSIPYDPNRVEILANVIGHDVDHVRQAIRAGVDLDLITILDSGEIWMNEIQNFIGQSSTEADRIREYRNSLKQKSLPNSSSDSVQMYDKSTPEIEIERELELKKEQDKDKESEVDKIPYLEIIEYLNTKSSSHYRSTDSTRRLIHARFNEGFTKEDFFCVIDKKVESWTGTEFEKYIRPQTLFSPKFESYLNEKIIDKKHTGSKEGYQVDISRYETL
jgi:uncharacterized phage protein (TIGR02220 family)/predicted phage replisome organizer